MNTTEESYGKLLQQVVFAPDADTREVYLSEAFELGRSSLMEETRPPDELVAIHHNAILRLAKAHPDMKLSDIAELLTLPLIEVSMSYGMSFREHLEEKYQTLLEKRLQESHKLEAVGTLAAGIAHEFNNLLCSMIGFSELAFEELVDGVPAKDSVQQVLIAGLQARDLVARMLQLARKDSALPMESLDMVPEIQSAIELVEIREKLFDISFRPGISQAFITARPGQIQQIIMNLCINAADAMEHRGAMVITLESTTAEECQIEMGNSAFCLTVSDQGTGISPEVQEQIFNPFFTTKEP